MSKKNIQVLLLLVICSINAIAQTVYYYSGKKIPLEINEDKVCVSIPKSKEGVCLELLKKIDVLDTIIDEYYDIAIIRKSDLKKLSVTNSWRKEVKSTLISPCYCTIDGNEVFSTPYINVRLRRSQDVNLLTAYAERYGLRILKQDPFLPLWYILSISSKTGDSAINIANKLWESGDFAASQPDMSSKDFICSNDPMFSLQWGLYNSGHPDIDISAPLAWNYATGKNIKIAILDTGVDLNHIDLAANISDLSYDTETDSSPSMVYSYHGTHCAGIAAAVKDNNIHIAGVAPDAKIISISNTLKGTTNSRLKRADGIIWAYQHGADIISNSWISSTYHAAIDEAIHEAFRYGRQGKGCVIVFATGNGYDSNIDYPACSNDTILAVGAIRHDGIRADFSNYGAGLDILAPGFNIYSTFPGNRTLVDSGTSMACPHVAGVAALILERNSELTVSQVNSIICSNAKKVQGINFNVTKPDGLWNEEYGYGLVDAYSSVINTPTTAYIQNETITGIRVISAERIYVGRNVTNTKEYGDVGLGPGDITMKAKCTVIKNSTTVPVGTKLKIGS